MKISVNKLIIIFSCILSFGIGAILTSFGSSAYAQFILDKQSLTVSDVTLADKKFATSTFETLDGSKIVKENYNNTQDIIFELRKLNYKLDELVRWEKSH